MRIGYRLLRRSCVSDGYSRALDTRQSSALALAWRYFLDAYLPQGASVEVAASRERNRLSEAGGGGVRARACNLVQNDLSLSGISV
jgi:hypothetical protein